MVNGIPMLDENFRCPEGQGGKANGSGFIAASWTSIDYAPLLGYANSTAQVNLYSVRRAGTAFLMDGANYGGSAGIWNDASFAKLAPSSSWRHNGEMNAAFCDGHVALLANPTFEAVVQTNSQ